MSEQYYNVTEQQIIWFSNVWYISYILLAFPLMKIFAWRLDYTVIIGTLFNALGNWVRVLAQTNYGISLFGQLLIAFGQLFILPAPVYIAEVWFAVDERATATALAFFCNCLGLSFGFLSSNYLIGMSVLTFSQYLIMMASISTGAIIFCGFVFKNKPKTPPSVSSESKKTPIMESLKALLFEKKNLFLQLATSLYLGISWVFLTVIDEILSPKGFDSSSIGIVGLCMNVAGTAGGLLSTYYIEEQLRKNKIPAYDKILKILATISMLTVVAFSLMLQYSNLPSKPIIYILSSFVGIGFNAFIPVAAQSMIETFYPCDELVTWTTFNIYANCWGYIGDVVSQIAIWGNQMWLITFIMIPIYLYLMIFYKTDLKRLRAEKGVDKLSNDSKDQQQK